MNETDYLSIIDNIITDEVIEHYPNCFEDVLTRAQYSESDAVIKLKISGVSIIIRASIRKIYTDDTNKNKLKLDTTILDKHLGIDEVSTIDEKIITFISKEPLEIFLKEAIKNILTCLNSLNFESFCMYTDSTNFRFKNIIPIYPGNGQNKRLIRVYDFLQKIQ